MNERIETHLSIGGYPYRLRVDDSGRLLELVGLGPTFPPEVVRDAFELAVAKLRREGRLTG